MRVIVGLVLWSDLDILCTSFLIRAIVVYPCEQNNFCV